MKKTITLLLVLLTIVSAHSQNFFETIIPPIDGVFREAQHAAETEDHGYIVTCVAHDLGDTDMILSIGPDGQVRNSFVEQIQDKNPKYCTLFRHPDQDDTYVIIAVLSLGGHNCSDYTQNTMAFLRVDGNLNIISRNFLEFGDDWLKLGYRYGYNENWLPKFVMEDDGTLSMAAHCLKTDGWRYVFARLTLDGTIIQMKEDQTMIIGVDFMYDFFVRNKSNGSYGLIKYCQNELGGYYYYNVESDFTSNMVVKRLCGMELKRIPENVQIPDSTYYLGTNDIKISPTICCYNDSIMLMSHTSKVYDRKGHSWNCQFVTTIDDSLNVGDMIVWHKNMSEMSPMTRSMSICDEAIYCCTILGMNEHIRKTTATIYSTTIMLTKFDKDLRQIWSRYYEGNDMFYDLNSVMATDDGGCIMTGVCSKKDSYHTFYTYILKVDADGYDAIAENAEQTVKPYHCYPNPTSDRIFIDISPDVECTRIDVYAIDGRLMQSQGSDFERVDMSGLEPGIYIIKVRLADGREFAERIVKE